MMKIFTYKWSLSLLLFLLLGILLRFYNLNWGTPYFFHPDERNIASAISQLQFPLNLNPHFFAYGAVPIYTTFAVGLLQNYLQQPIPTVSFEQAILILRSFSAFFSVLLIPLVFFLGKYLRDTSTGLLASFFVTTSIGLIQYAHFGTFEMWLTLLTVLFFLSHLFMWQKKQWRYSILQSVILGLLVSTKISSLVLIPLLFLHPLLWENIAPTKKLIFLIKQSLLVGIITLGIFLLTNPYSILDFTSFYNSISYESAVATGELKVFYTGEFVETIPVLYHLINVYPFLLNPLVFSLFLPALFFIGYLGIKKRKRLYLLLCLYTLILFLSQAFLFVKWTRYLIPTLPFIYLLIALFLTENMSKVPLPIRRVFSGGCITLIGIVCLVFAFAFFTTVYVRPDTRVEAVKWAEQQLPPDAQILSEVYDLGIIPFNERFSTITLYNFYDLDNASPMYNDQTLQSARETHSHLVLPSQRIMKSRLLHPEEFPKGAAFYSSLLEESGEFTTLYTTPCDLWCQITYWGNPVFAFEGTVNIFDRPTIFIFEKK